MLNKTNSRRIRCIFVFEPFEPRRLMSTYTVNTPFDLQYVEPSQLSLRQAIADANSHAGPDTINFDPRAFKANAANLITLQFGELEFTDTTGTTTMTGPGAATLAINGANQTQVFKIDTNVSVAVSGVSIVGGRQTFTQTGNNTFGGGIWNAGTLAVTNCTIANNTVYATGTLEFVGDNVSYIPGDALGGGIYSTGKLTVTGSTFTGNTVTNNFEYSDELPPIEAGAAYGGAIYATSSLTLTSDTFNNNTVAGADIDDGGDDGDYTGPAFGGAVYVAASLSLQSCTVNGNTASAGQGVYNGFGGDASGGGIYTQGTVSVLGSTITNNSAIAGESGFEEGGSGVGRGGGIYAGASAIITNSRISFNLAHGGTDDTGQEVDTGDQLPSAGGGIYTVGSASLSLDNIDNNAVQAGPGGSNTPNLPAGVGGGIYTSQLQMQQCSVTNNNVTSNMDEYGITEYRFGGPTCGGGIYTAASSSINASTVAGNSVSGGQGYQALLDDFDGEPTPGGNGFGGGIYAAASLTLIDSTITGNAATGGAGGDLPDDEHVTYLNGGDASGGGVFCVSDSIIDNDTITDNYTTGGAPGYSALPYELAGRPGVASGAGLFIVSTGASINNTILSANKADQAFQDVTGPMEYGSNGNVIAGTDNPDLSTLGYYGGPTQSIIPLPGSPAINNGVVTLVPVGTTTDQRGFPRTLNRLLDIGSTQVGGGTLTGIVFNDESASGTRQTVDPGLDKFTVYVDINHDGKLDAGDLSTATNSTGLYTFCGLTQGMYSLYVVNQNGYRQTTPSTSPVYVTTKTGITTIGPNFGETQDALLSGSVINATTKKPVAGTRVYLDLNDDAKWESTEPSVVVNSTGTWSFNIAAVGKYQVRIVPPSGYKTSSPANGLFSFSLGKASARIENIFDELQTS